MRPPRKWFAGKFFFDREVEAEEAKWGRNVEEADHDTWELRMDPFDFYGPSYVPADDGSLDDNEWLEDGE